MREELFRKCLMEKSLAKSSISYWIRSCRRIERIYNLDLESVSTSEADMQKLRRAVYDDPRLTRTQRKNYPSGLKKYYECVNGKELPRLERKKCTPQL